MLLNYQPGISLSNRGPFIMIHDIFVFAGNAVKMVEIRTSSVSFLLSLIKANMTD